MVFMPASAKEPGTSPPSNALASRPAGTCTMKGMCGRPSLFSPELPCAVDDVPAETPDSSFRSLLSDVCGPEFASGPVCCEQGQVEVLASNLEQANPLISSCPACANNFRQFWCSFTCSPSQGQFLDVVETQDVDGSGDAVKRVNYYVSDQFREGFYDSCKNVQFGATNGFAMDLIGGGARTADEFLAYMGQERPLLGSPFQIDFPRHFQQGAATSNSTAMRSKLPPLPLDVPARDCTSSDLGSRCACTDCPGVCTSLPEIPAPRDYQQCQLFGWPCVQLVLLILYFFALAIFYAGFRWKRSHPSAPKATSRSDRGSNVSVADSAPDAEHHHLDPAQTGSSSNNGLPESEATGTEEGNLVAPKARESWSSVIHRKLSNAMYSVGLHCARNPWQTFAVASLVLGVANLGWVRFTVETDPVRLWVAPNSTAKNEKDFFDQEFGPFYKTEQIFVTDMKAKGFYRLLDPMDHDNAIEDFPPVLDWDRLQWWSDVEAEIRSLKAGPNETTFQDVCFAPTGSGGPCVVQSIMGYFQDGLNQSGVTKKNWYEMLNRCAWHPAECLPSFGQPLKPNAVLGGVPIDASPAEARALVGTWVVENSLDPTILARAEMWENELQAFLRNLTGDVPEGTELHPLATRAKKLGLDVSFSTGVSLEQEISSSTNTDTGIVALSYLLMLLYAALALGGGYIPGRRSLRNGQTAPTAFWSDVQLALSPRRGGAIRLSDDNDPDPYGPDARSQARARLVDSFFVRSKFTLGLFGILIVLVAIASAAGIWSALGVRVTLVIAEVIPFLVLAVGVDNIFLLSNEMDRQNTLSSTHNPYYLASRSDDLDEEGRASASVPGAAEPDASAESAFNAPENVAAFYLSAEERAARALARIGPSIVLSATIQVTSFLLGALVPMPAVRNFTLYAAGSMFIAAALHCTVFVAALALDARRTEGSRIDCLPCAQARTPRNQAVDSLTVSTNTDLVAESWLQTFMRGKYAPFIVRPTVKRVALALFVLLGARNIMLSSEISMGLDQRLALPPGSYLRDYFDAVDTWLDVGPPVYFIEWRADTKVRYVQRQLCARFTTCAPFSVANTLEGERKRPESSFIIEPAASWIDDFFQWLNPVLENCCRVRKDDPSTFCAARDSEFACRPCFEGREYNITLEGLPQSDEFMMFLRQWLKSPTTAECPLGGAAAYSSAVSFRRSNLTVKEPLLDRVFDLSDLAELEPTWTGPVPDREDRKLSVYASHFRTSHVPLRSQAEFIYALKSARRIAKETSERSGVRLFAYSLFYPFFDQYLHLKSLTVQVLGSAALAVFGISFILLGCWRTAAVIVLCVASTILGVVGSMGQAEVEFNALTLVNLSVCAAIGVEFCAHVAKAFMRAPGGGASDPEVAQRQRDDRVQAAVGDVGASVVTGITGTKLVGLSVLWFTKSELLKLYYARMWMTLIQLGVLHGLVLLPVLLSFYGGPALSGVNNDDESEIRRRLLRAQDRNAYRPFTDDEAAYSDDEA